MERVMERSRAALETVGEFTRGNLPVWMRDVVTDREFELFERVIRLEARLNSQRETFRTNLERLEARIDRLERARS